MFQRRKSLTARILETVPVFVIIAMGIAGVMVAMTVLVTAVPAGYELGSSSPSASASPSATARPGSPSILPTVATRSVRPTAPLPTTNPVVINSVIDERDPAGVWVVYVLYPSFKEGTTPWAPAINADIRAEMDALATRFEDGPAADRQAPKKVNTLFSTFTRDLVTPALTSFTLTWTADVVPNYPETGAISINYDMGTGQTITFADVFDDYQTALALFSQKAPALLQAKLGSDYDQTMAADGTSPILSNYPNWGLTGAGLKLTFPPDTVAPVTRGWVSIVIPWSALKPIMIQTGPVAQLAGF
jgi:hypothetical protein